MNLQLTNELITLREVPNKENQLKLKSVDFIECPQSHKPILLKFYFKNQQ